MKKTICLFATGEWAQVKALAVAMRAAAKPDAAEVLIRDASMLSLERGQGERFDVVTFADDKAAELLQAAGIEAVSASELLPKQEAEPPVPAPEPPAPPPTEPEPAPAAEAPAEPAAASPAPARKRAAPAPT